MTDGSLQAVGALGIGLGGRLAFGHWTLPGRSVYPRAEKEQQKETPLTKHLPAGRAIQRHPAGELGCVVIRPWPLRAEPHRCHYSERPVELSFEESSLSFLTQSVSPNP